MFSFPINCDWFLLRACLVDGKYLGDYAYPLAGHALAEQNAHSWPYIFRMSHEFKHDRGGVIGAQFLTTHNSTYNCRLTYTTNMYSGLKAYIYGCCMEQYRYLGLKYKMK